MATYQSVSWQPGDELTSVKMQQMAQNDEWLKDNLIIGNVNFPRNGAGQVAAGRTAGAFKAKRVEGIAYKFDSSINRRWYDFRVNFPSVYTKPPIIIHSVYSPFKELTSRVISGGKTNYAVFRVWDTGHRSLRLDGELDIILIGE
jgi:hypothetical protein